MRLLAYLYTVAPCLPVHRGSLPTCTTWLLAYLYTVAPCLPVQRGSLPTCTPGLLAVPSTVPASPLLSTTCTAHIQYVSSVTHISSYIQIEGPPTLYLSTYLYTAAPSHPIHYPDKSSSQYNLYSLHPVRIQCYTHR